MRTRIIAILAALAVAALLTFSNAWGAGDTATTSASQAKIIRQLGSIKRDLRTLKSDVKAIKGETTGLRDVRTLADRACRNAKSSLDILNQEFGHALTEFECSMF